MGEDGTALFGRMTNLGVRAPNVEAELRFLEHFGAGGLIHTQGDINGAPAERFHVHLGGTRIALFRKASYDDRLAAINESRGGGLAHVAFAVQSTAEVIKRAAAIGVEPLLGPYEVDVPTGPRRLIAFFRSPNGLILETQETL